MVPCLSAFPQGHFCLCLSNQGTIFLAPLSPEPPSPAALADGREGVAIY